ncbi:MAG: ABC-F family ATP-binding cassette domain-containing protein [Pseudoxanthomonas sp.]
MSDPRIRVHDLSFSWPDGTPVLSGLSFALGAARSGLVAPNGAGKSTMLKLLAGQLPPQSGSIEIHGSLGYLPQHVAFDGHASVADVLGIATRLDALDAVHAGKADAAHFDLLDGDWDVRERTRAMLGRLGLGDIDLHRPLSSFSGGEAMLLALAAQLLRHPGVLLLDEPSNQLDRHARQRLREMLAQWRGCLLIASHDRELLEGMEQVCELEPSRLRIYGGGFSLYRAAVEAERTANEQRLRNLRSEAKREQRDQQQARERADRRASNAVRNLADAGLPRIVAGLRASNAQVSTGKAEGMHAERLANVRAQLKEAAATLDDAEAWDLSLPATRVAQDGLLFHGENLHVQHAGCELWPGGVSLTLRGPERIGLLGANGSGKTSLLQILAGERTPQSGGIRRGSGRVAFLSQQLDLLAPESSVADNFARHAPHMPAAERSHLLARLGFRGERMQLPVAALSGGERLRATLACVLHAEPPPRLLLLDEPSNNLDLATVAQLEQALRAYQGALVVVSHDVAFLDAIDLTRRVELDAQGLHELAC